MLMVNFQSKLFVVIIFPFIFVGCKNENGDFNVGVSLGGLVLVGYL